MTNEDVVFYIWKCIEETFLGQFSRLRAIIVYSRSLFVVSCTIKEGLRVVSSLAFQV